MVHVNGSTFSSIPGMAGQAGYVPLTVEKLSTPGDLYYADPHPDNGQIQSDDIVALLQYQGGPGPIITGEPGRPMSEYQLTGVRPVSRVVTSLNGERTVGYPELGFSFTNKYTIPSGLLKGFSLGGSIVAALKRGDLYYYENGYYEGEPRKLFYRGSVWRFDLIFGYDFKIGKITWSTQLNIDNVFDNQQWMVRPNSLWGFNTWTGGPNTPTPVRLQALQTMQPRTFIWTNTIKF